METQPARHFLPLPEAPLFDRAPRAELNRRISFQALRNSPLELQTTLGLETWSLESQTMLLLEVPSLPRARACVARCPAMEAKRDSWRSR